MVLPEMRKIGGSVRTTWTSLLTDHWTWNVSVLKKKKKIEPFMQKKKPLHSSISRGMQRTRKDNSIPNGVDVFFGARARKCPLMCTV